MTVAFSEGFATAFASMVMKESVYRDGYTQGGFHINLEGNVVETAGWYSERSVSSLLYDFYDESNGATDTLSLGIKGMLDVMRDELPQQPAQASIFSFMTGLYHAMPEAESEVVNLLLRQEINPYDLDAYGSTEINDAGVTDLLPIYKLLTVNGDSVTSCSIDDFMTYEYNSNKLGARQYLRFTVDESSANEEHVISVVGDFGRDPEISVFHQGVIIYAARNPGGHSESLTHSLAGGEYIVEIGDFFNLTIPLGKTCFEVSVATQ